jgi:quercetin dioxygenase-like cupin family protein
MAATHGDGWAAAHLDDLGSGPGFRKVRGELGVEAFGVNAIVLPAGMVSRFHTHDEQEELYFLHSGEIDMEFGGGEVRHMHAGDFVRVAAPTPRRLRNVGDGDAVYVCVGGKGGYVGRDGRPVEEDAPAG